MPNAQHRMQLTSWGTLTAVGTGGDETADQRAGKVCPFSDLADNETQIARALFRDSAVHERIGRLHIAFAGYVIEGNFREYGSSGGFGTWLLEELLRRDLVDAVVHVGETSGEPDAALFKYRVSRSVDELRRCSKSHYYAVTLADIVSTVRHAPGRYAFVGVPCFIKAIRLLAREDGQFGASVAVCIGLVCGHLKSRAYAEFLAWQMGIEPALLNSIDFRVKIEGRTANRYGVKAVGRAFGAHVERVRPMRELYGHDWGMGFFKPKACDYCDDVVAETADITIGDAWLPRYVADSGGTNLLIVRNTLFQSILRKAIEERRIKLDEISPDEIEQSQGAGYSHRREGLAYRLWLADRHGQWRPVKRVDPRGGAEEGLFERRHRLRMRLAQMSHEAFLEAKRSGDITVFFRHMHPAVEAYRDTYRPLWKRFLNRLRLWVYGDPLIRRLLRGSTQFK